MQQIQLTNPWQTHNPGDLVTVADDVARSLIAAGYATPTTGSMTYGLPQPGTSWGPARLFTSLTTVPAVTFTPGTLPTGLYDTGLALTYLGNGNPVEVSLSGIATLVGPSGGGIPTGWLFLQDAADLTHYLHVFTLKEVTLAAAATTTRAVAGSWTDDRLAAGASRTMKLLEGASAANLLQLAGRDVLCDLTLRARNG